MVNFPDYYGVGKKETKKKKKSSKWEVAGFCEDSEYERSMLENAAQDLREAGLKTKIEGSSYGYVLYVK